MFFSFPLTDTFTPAHLFPLTQRQQQQHQKKHPTLCRGQIAWTKIGKRNFSQANTQRARDRWIEQEKEEKEEKKSGNKMPRIAFDIENRHETHIYLMPLHKARVVNGFDDELNKQR